ncbi:MAG: ferredoxin [Euryarchaeota archaeon]|nr:ferredoxin [Euryarchaeota archaeon]
MAGKAHVTLERDNCISCGNCWSTCPDFFEESPEDGRSQVAMKHRSGEGLSEGDAPEDQDECVRSAAEGCPAEVIHIG